MYHACTLRGPPAGLETSSQGTGCVHCVLDTHTRLAPRGLLRLAPCLLRCRVQRANALADSWNRFLLPISGGVLWAAQFVQQSSEREETVVLEHHGRTMIHCCLPSQRPCFAPARALGAGRATVPRTSSQRPCRAPAARLGSVGTFSVVTYVNCLRPTAAELLPFSTLFMHQLTPAPQHLLNLEARYSLSLRRTRAASNRATAAHFHGVLAF